MSALCFSLHHHFSSPHWSHMATCLLPGSPEPKFTFASEGTLQHPSWDNSLARPHFWCYGLYLFPKFPWQDFEWFSWALYPGCFLIWYPSFQVCPWLLSWPLDIPIQFLSTHLEEADKYSYLRVLSLILIVWSKTHTTFPVLGRIPRPKNSLHVSPVNCPKSSQHLNTSAFSFCRRNLCAQFNGKTTVIYIESWAKDSSLMLSSDSITDSKPAWQT